MRLSAYIFASIRENRGKYLVSILGIMVAIGTFFTLSLYSAQFASSFDSFYGLYENTLFVVDENTELSKMVPVNSKINESYAEEIENLPGVFITVKVLFADLSNYTVTQFVPDRIYAFEMGDINFISQYIGLDYGTWPESPDEIVVGQYTFDQEHDETSIGTQVDIKGTNFYISGVLDFNSHLYNHFIYMDYSAAQTALSMEGICSLIYVVYNENTNPMQLKTSIQDSYPVIALNMNDLNANLGGIYNAIEMGEFVIGLLPLLISSIFFFVLITYIVRTRTREYALLKTIGFSEVQLITFLFVEVMVISVIGYLLGSLVGYFFYTLSFQFVTSRPLSLAFDSWDFYWTSILVTVKYNFWTMFALLCGLNLISTTFPALSIRRKSIVEVIRT
ncbi:MAG: ABC transporter permease [Candidatus Lokiarchaeota archaeon]|nr:ABC transporter permease [Candidatus Lokiarchaeota archaeon]